jgi:hypothetical protein
VAIDNKGVNNQFWNNTINGGLGFQADVDGLKSIVFRQSATANGTTIRNNIFFTSAGGVLDAAGGRCLDVDLYTAIPGNSISTISDNDFFSCGGSIVYDRFNDTEYDISDAPAFVTGAPGLDEVGNIQDFNPGFVSIGANPGRLGAADVDWHLTAGSPAQVRTGAPTCPSYTDRAGEGFGNEGGGSAMGAYASPTAGGC